MTGTTGPGGSVGYTYDLDGRQLSAGSRTFSWAQPDRLATTSLGNTTTTYTYDGDGLRTLASTGSQANKKIQYDWDPNGALAQLVTERNGSGNLLRRYRGGLDTVMLDSGGNPSYFHYDGLGSVVNLTGASGATQWTYAYLPYGGVRIETKNQGSAPDNVLRFTGEVLDPTGLYQLRARSYDPASGRFLSIDPAAAGPSDPYVSAYAYVNGNPIRYADPSGRCPWCIAGAIGAGIGAVVGVVSYAGGTIVGNVLTGEEPTKGLDPGAAINAAVGGAVVGGVSGATFGLGTAALGATTLSATSAEAWALASFSGPLGSAAGIIFKGLTGQDVGGSDAVGALTNMVPLPSALPLQVGLGILFDQFGGAIGNAFGQLPRIPPSQPTGK